MDPRVMVVKEGTADLQFLLEIVFKLRVDVVNYGPVTTDSFITWEADAGCSKGSLEPKPGYPHSPPWEQHCPIWCRRLTDPFLYPLRGRTGLSMAQDLSPSPAAFLGHLSTICMGHFEAGSDWEVLG